MYPSLQSRTQWIKALIHFSAHPNNHNNSAMTTLFAGNIPSEMTVLVQTSEGRVYQSISLCVCA